jgi:hypothetical protein
MTVNLEDSRLYKGGYWANFQPVWFTSSAVYSHKGHYSSVGLGFRTSIAGRSPLNRGER